MVDRRLPISSVLGGVEPEEVQEAAPVPAGPSAGPDDARQAVERLVAMLLQIPVVREMIIQELSRRGLNPGSSGPLPSPSADLPPAPSRPAPGPFAAKLAQLRSGRPGPAS